MNIKEGIARAVSNLDLSREEMMSIMRDIMTGQCTHAQIGSFLTAMRMKSE
ncbi:anthranilate phosphoribosyltransferase, partial [Pseudoalteromonas sp. S4492]